MQVQPYLLFDGRTEEALEFYRKTLGAKVDTVMRFKEAPDQSQVPPGAGEKVMHAAFRVGDTTIMASDGMCAGTSKFQGFSLTIPVKSESEADRVFNALADGGQVQMPIGKTFFSPRFGVVADRFGMSWMVMVAD